MNVLLKNADALKQRFQFARSRKGVDLLGIHLSNGDVKIVHGNETNKEIIFLRFMEQKFSEDDEAGMSQFLIESSRELRVKKQREIYCVIPASLFISKNVDMPSRNDEEIRKIVDLQANRYTPYSRDELIIDYMSMATEREHYTNVLLIIVQRKVMEQYSRILEGAGLEVERIIIAPEGMASSFTRLGELPSPMETVGGIHIGADASNLTVIDDGHPAFIRSIPIGSDRLIENKEEAQLELLKELNKSMIAYQNQGVGKPLKALVVTGVVKELAYLKEEMRRNIPILYASNIPIKVCGYEDCFKLTPEARNELETNTKSSFFEILSAVSKYSDLKIDLTPNEVKLKKKFREGGRNIIMLGVIIMSFFLMISFFLMTKIQLKNFVVGKLNTIHESSFEQARVLEQTSTQSRFLRSFIQERGRPLHIFERITAMIGKDIYLSVFEYTDETLIHLTGTAESMSRVFNFVTELESSDFFSNVTTNQTKSRREGGRDVADFDIECTLRDEL